VDERRKFLKQIQAADFTLYDLSLYLDTHPTDAMALNYFKEYNDYSKLLKEAYVSAYGPLQHSDFQGGDWWNWVDKPWPWEKEV
jgi:spore coat protein JB